MDNLNQNSSTPSFALADFNKGKNQNKNLALEASAGTGKTFSIKEMVKKLVCEFHVGLDKILVVTYTEKAAGELKNEIRKVLTEPQEEYQNKSVIEVLKEQNLDVNVDINNASIGTIHSFCKSTIEEFAIKSKQPLNLELAGDVTLNDFAKRFIRDNAGVLKLLTAFFANKMEINENTLVEKLVATANKYYLDNRSQEDPSVILYKKSYQPNEIPQIAFDLINSADVPSTLKQKYPEHFQAYITLQSYSGGIFPDWLNEFDDYYQFILGNKTYKVAQNPKDPTAFKYPKLICEAYKKLSATKTAFINFKPECYVVDLFINEFYQKYEQYKADNRLQNFNDMIRVIREEFKDSNSALLRQLQDKYTYGIIDEFQDTNQIQFDIFKKIFMSDNNHHIIVVGDPKQSIYSFQGADVTVYKKAVKEIEEQGGLKMRLDKNYRSYKGVVEFGNELFKHYAFDPKFEASKYCSIKDGDNYELRLLYKGEYAPGLWLNEKPMSVNSFAKFAVEQILDCVTLDGNGHTNLQFVKYKKGEKEPTIFDANFGDFVVLSRTRTELPQILRALRKAHIPVVRYKDDSLFKSKECAHWVALLEAIDVVDFTGYNRGFFKKALFTDFFGLSLSEISNPYYDQDQCPQIPLFVNWRMIAKDRRWEDLFDAILDDTKLEERLSSLDHLQSLAIYKQIVEYAIDYLANNYTLTDLIDHLKKITKVSNEESEGDNASIVAKATDFKAVRIMTMHASKGLQFPVVISVGGWKGQNTRGGCFTCHLPMGDDGKVQQYVFTLKEVDNERYKNANKKEFDEEVLRLFYVAYTRPQYLLIAPRYITEKDKNKNQSSAMEAFITECKSKSYDVDGHSVNYYWFKNPLDLSIPDMERIAEASLEKAGEEASANQAVQNAGKSDDADKQKDELKKIIKNENNQVAYRHSYSNLAHPAKEEMFDEENILDREEIIEDDLTKYDEHSSPIDAKYDDSKETAKTPDGYPKGAGMGNAIHEVFENINFENPDHNVEDIIIDRFKSYGFTFEKGSEFLRHTKEDIVKNVLEADLPEIIGEKATGQYFKLKELSSENRKAEAEFDFNYPNEKLKNYFIGFIDLLFKREVDGVEIYSVLDWKSDTITDKFLSYKDKTELKKQVDRRYSIQRVLYSYCLIKWLKKIYNITEEEAFNKHFGGIYYVFVRGCNKDTSNGIYSQTWASWDVLEKAFLDICKIK